MCERKEQKMAEEKKTKPVATVKTESLKADTAVKAAESAKKTVKAAVKKASAKKAEVKAEVKEAVKEVKTEVKEAAKEVKAAAKKAAPAKKEVKAAAKKPAAKKAAPAKKAENVSYNISLQYQDKDWNVNGLVQSAKDVWVYDMGRKLDEIKTIDLYVKPEESKVYFVVNGTENGEFAL